jgi:uncharacterized spore protein YtfJ
MAQITEALTNVREVLGVKRVFGEAVEKDGITVIPVATVGGAGGGGGDHNGDGGGGFALTGRPVGAYVIKDGQVQFEPAIDIARLAMIGAVCLFILRGFLPWRSRRRRRSK